MPTTTTSPSIPRPGMIAAVRNRHATVAAVDPFDGPAGRLHLVHVAYQDAGSPSSERLVWEIEPHGTRLLEPTALPDATGDPMPAADFDALLRAARWTALSPYLGVDGKGRETGDGEPIASPFHGGIRSEDFQLVPLLKALRMPRVSMLIADDVGLGKTIEAGLILTELLLRRRIRWILVLTPAALRVQWKEELWEKFSLSFEVIDRSSTARLRRTLGIDANPWRSYSRIIASYHYLRQPDVREEFLAACRVPQGSAHLPWDLLIVDECHNLMPAPFGEDSQLCRMLGIVAPRFEHRLFLSATLHNGHTRSFTGLLEILDPVRFNRVDEMTPAMRKRVDDVVVRRLKRDINANASSRPRFCARKPPRAVPLVANVLEAELTAAFDAFRSAVRGMISGGSQGRRRAGTFAVEVLGKRLLSCPAAFADSWFRTMQGMVEGTASEAEVDAQKRALGQETGDDREAEKRRATAATVVGGWLRNYSRELASEIDRIRHAIEALGFNADDLPPSEQCPASDVRFDALVAIVEKLLCAKGRFEDDERLIVFTEYKTTLDYLVNRLRARYPANRVLTLFGSGGPAGMDSAERDRVKAAFNDPVADVRVLIATDAAAEGLNLHRTARYLLHYDCPWNPSRLEQRNGRLDRYGQARDVMIHHFDSSGDPDVRFLAHVIRKANDIREDLGSANEIFDRAVRRRLVEGEDAETVRNDLDLGIGRIQTAGQERLEATPAEAGIASRSLNTLASTIGLDGQAMKATLEAAMAVSGPLPQVESADEPGLFRLCNPGLHGWRRIIDQSVRCRAPAEHGLSTQSAVLGPLRQLAFDPGPFLERLGHLEVFRTRPDALLVHLAHPMMKRALNVLTRRQFPGKGAVSRWTVQLGGVPGNADALILLSIEELCVNALRETFHHWVRTVAFPVVGGEVEEPLPVGPPGISNDARPMPGPGHREHARVVLEAARRGLRKWLRGYQTELSERLRDQVKTDAAQAREREDERFRRRQGEVSRLIERSTIDRLTAEVQRLKLKREQGVLFDDAGNLARLDRSIEEKEREVARRRSHYADMREQLARERTRIIERVLPARFALSGEAKVFPLTIEVRLPGADRSHGRRSTGESTR